MAPRSGPPVLPVVGWAERGGYGATGPGNSVPRFHITWGTGPGVLAPFLTVVEKAEKQGRLVILPRHRVTSLISHDDTVAGARGEVLESSPSARGTESSRVVVASFEIEAGATFVTSGGIGGNQDLVRRMWPSCLGTPPSEMLAGVPGYVDGSMLSVAEAVGARLVNGDRMWHYVEGIRNTDPVWPGHGIRLLPGPSSLWLDATGTRLPVPLFPGFDTLGTLEHLRRIGHDHSWFVTTRRIVEKEFALSGCEQNPDLTGKDLGLLLRSRLAKGPPAPVQSFLDHGEDFVDDLDRLIARMRTLPGGDVLDPDRVRQEVAARDLELNNGFAKDAQIAMVRAARSYHGDRLIRTASPHRLEDPTAGPLIAVRLRVLTRKSLGGPQTNLDGRVLSSSGAPISGLFAVGEASGFGGGGMHGYRALEGTFLDGCLFSGRQAGRAASV